MRKVLIAIFLLILTTPLFSQDIAIDNIKTTVNDKKVNFGLKAGFSSTIYITNGFELNSKKIDTIQNIYKIGYNFSAFLRYNIAKHYIQTEVGYYINRAEIEFDKNQGTDNAEQDNAYVRSRLHSIDIPILYGYNFIKKGIYGMSFFIGPKVKFNLNGQHKISYSNLGVDNIEEKLYPVNFGATLGISVYISRVFFDFRYDQILHNISKSVSYSNPSGAAAVTNVKLHRRDNMLSFSLGIIL